jgi:hypothetical protein
MLNDPGAIAIVMVFSIPLVAIITGHMRKMAELKLRLQQERSTGSDNEFTGLRQQLTDLRDLTTKYDLSFDQALQRIEARTARLEERVDALERTETVDTQTR